VVLVVSLRQILVCDRGSLSLPPFFESVGLFVCIPHGDGYQVFQSSAVRQPAMVDGSYSPLPIKMVVDVRSSLINASQGWCWRVRSYVIFNVLHLL
jgi:hypothetical protein